jgi:hypothetical protein
MTFGWLLEQAAKANVASNNKVTKRINLFMRYLLWKEGANGWVNLPGKG